MLKTVGEAQLKVVGPNKLPMFKNEEIGTTYLEFSLFNLHTLKREHVIEARRV